MSKPGEMVQILREAYEEQLEAYRLLRNKFLIAVPGMDLDKEKQLYDQWKLDLHLNSIISFDRALPPDPRTCETCVGKGYTAEHSPGPNDHDDEGNCLGACPVQVQCEHCNGTGVEPRAPQSADVERLREALTNIHDYGIDRDGETTAEKLGELVDELVKLAREALAATADGNEEAR